MQRLLSNSIAPSALHLVAVANLRIMITFSRSRDSRPHGHGEMPSATSQPPQWRLRSKEASASTSTENSARSMQSAPLAAEHISVIAARVDGRPLCPSPSIEQSLDSTMNTMFPISAPNGIGWSNRSLLRTNEGFFPRRRSPNIAPCASMNYATT